MGKHPGCMSDETSGILERYRWVNQAMPSCISLVRDRSPLEVIEGLARNSTIEVGPGSVEAAYEWAGAQDYRFVMASVVRAVAVGPWTLAVEENGWQGTTAEVVAPLSVRTEALSYYWSVNADMRFVRAVDGIIVRQFDPLLDYDRGVLRRGTPLDQEIGLPGANGVDRGVRLRPPA
jgi:Family of unknown function (DUF6461)